MTTPIEISFHGIDRSEAAELRVRSAPIHAREADWSRIRVGDRRRLKPGSKLLPVRRGRQWHGLLVLKRGSMGERASDGATRCGALGKATVWGRPERGGRK